jgi:hypothetical protein
VNPQTTSRQGCERNTQPSETLIEVAMSSVLEASVPMINCREKPKSAQATSGSRLAYSPTIGGNPDNCPYAIPVGMITAATVRPASASCGRSLRQYTRIQVIPGTRRGAQSRRISVSVARSVALHDSEGAGMSSLPEPRKRMATLPSHKKAPLSGALLRLLERRCRTAKGCGPVRRLDLACFSIACARREASHDLSSRERYLKVRTH